MDEAKIVATLNDYLAATDMVLVASFRQVGNKSYGGGFHAERPPDEDEVLRQNEIVRPILDALYPEWRRDHGHRGTAGSKSVERVAVKTLLARLEAAPALADMLGGMLPKLAVSGFHELVAEAAAPAWRSGRFANAVDAAARKVNAHLQSVTGRADLSDKDLVAQAFSDKGPEPSKPRLRYPHITDEQTRRSVEQGVRAFGQGCFQAIRNPLAHRPDEEHGLGEQLALERLAAFSLFARWIDEATLEEA